MRRRLTLTRDANNIRLSSHLFEIVLFDCCNSCAACPIKLCALSGEASRGLIELNGLYGQGVQKEYSLSQECFRLINEYNGDIWRLKKRHCESVLRRANGSQTQAETVHRYPGQSPWRTIWTPSCWLWQVTLTRSTRPPLKRMIHQIILHHTPQIANSHQRPWAVKALRYPLVVEKSPEEMKMTWKCLLSHTFPYL